MLMYRNIRETKLLPGTLTDGYGGECPHTFYGRPYYKVESTTKMMPQDMYDERIRAHQPQLYAWERLAADGVTLANLNENLFVTVPAEVLMASAFRNLHCMNRPEIFYLNGSYLRMVCRQMGLSHSFLIT